MAGPNKTVWAFRNRANCCVVEKTFHDQQEGADYRDALRKEGKYSMVRMTKVKVGPCNQTSYLHVVRAYTKD